MLVGGRVSEQVSDCDRERGERKLFELRHFKVMCMQSLTILYTGHDWEL